MKWKWLRSKNGINKITSRFTNLAGGCIKRDQGRLWGDNMHFEFLKVMNKKEKRKKNHND